MLTPLLADMAFGPVELALLAAGPIVVGLAAAAGVVLGGRWLIRRFCRRPDQPDVPE